MNQTDVNNSAVALLSSGVGLIVLLVVALIAVFCWCRIFAKAGYSWAMGLLMFIPLVNLVMILILAFGDWPIHRRLREQTAQVPAVSSSL